MIGIGSDHGGYDLKQDVIDYLEKTGLEYKDYGCFDKTSFDYPDVAEPLAADVASGVLEQGILICGTGIGISIAANKVKGIRAALCHDVFSAEATRLHNDANILCMGGRVVGGGLAVRIVDAFLSTDFSYDKRHERRVNKIMEIERER